MDEAFRFSIFLYWGAFTLPRPLGAVVGNLLDKSRKEGGQATNWFNALEILFALMLVVIFAFPQRPAKKEHLL